MSATGQPTPNLLRCPVCENKCTLVAIEPLPKAKIPTDLRTFKCLTCEAISAYEISKVGVFLRPAK